MTDEERADHGLGWKHYAFVVLASDDEKTLERKIVELQQNTEELYVEALATTSFEDSNLVECWLDNPFRKPKAKKKRSASK